MDDNSMLERLDLFIKYLGMSVRSFEDHIGASNGVLRKAIKHKSHIQSKWIEIIVELFPQLNPVWLLTGRENMLQNSVKLNNPSDSIDLTDSFKLDQTSSSISFDLQLNELKKIIHEKDIEIDNLRNELLRSKNDLIEILKEK